MKAGVLEDQHFLSSERLRKAQRISVWQACGLGACVNESILG
jgi:hypothetical protein